MLMTQMAAALLALTPMADPVQAGPGAQRVAPRGGYAQTCSGEYTNQGRLYADCRTRNGQIQGTSIQLNLCGNYEIQNTDGRLTCGPHRGDIEDGGYGRPDRPGWPGRPDRPDRPGWPDRPGNGGWGRNVITVYRDADFRGESRVFRGEIGNLENEGFNDVISSMRFEGAWEACTDSYFRGYCQTFTDDVRNLSWTGMNDRISSLRPVRRNR